MEVAHISRLSRVEIHDSIVRMMGLTSPPIGVSFLRSDPPKDAKRPDRECTFCEGVALSRREKHIIGLTKDNMDCPFALEVLGLQSLPWDMVTNVIESKRFGPHTLEFIRTIPKIAGGIYESVVIGPLKDLSMNPNVVLIHGTSDQIVKLVNAWTWVSGKPVSGSMQGIGGVCSESVAAAYVMGEPTICALPCQGARELGKLKIGETIFASIYSLLEELIEGLEAIEASSKDVESLVIDLLRRKGRMTTRSITSELRMLLPRCPDYPAQVLARMGSKGKIKSEFSTKDKGFVWWVEP